MDLEKLRQELLTLKARIATLEAQIREPEWVPFPGEIVEVSNPDEGVWHVRPFARMMNKDESWAEGELRTYNINPDAPVYLDGTNMGWTMCRPLSDPNIIQLRPHKGGDPMPCAFHQLVIVYYGDRATDRYSFGLAGHRNWHNAISWAPLPQVSP